ncbi:hypothetical protein EJ02DRAFT_410602 [Clathrospora elynae]|uniref:Uncharacterized protein n=1 Tax=Clathrospora elynae TaxID=706981 RepID=A0A6A5SEN8_9PLEO|nr:hypothetical protein EJ02DRAFT_410602 [Clathrospora elynae]
MSFAAGFGLDIAINAVVLGATLLPASQNAKVRLGCGSKARGETIGSLTGGGRPDIVLYDTHGEEFARSVGGEPFDPATNPTIDMGSNPLNSGSSTKTPEYIKLVARGEDAVCVGYVSATSAGDDKRTWHAGYAKECARHLNSNFWYPSPEVIPGTDFRPGCIWLSSGVRFLQAISVKLTDFAFPTGADAEKARTQFEQTPNTLCQAPGRMTFWETEFSDDCIPYYDFDVEKDNITGFDTDYQKVVSGHTLPCNPRGTAFNQTLEPGKGPETFSPEQIQQKEEEKRKQEEEQQTKNENGENDNALLSGSDSFGGEAGTTTQEETNEQGLDPDGPLAGAGGFGGVCGLVPETGEFAHKAKPCPGAPPVTSRPSQVRRRESAQTKDQCVDRLVISHLKDHSAREVCGMTSSWGPDFVSVTEGLHCDMCTREISRLCGQNSQDQGCDACFDLEKRFLRGSSAGNGDECETLYQEAKLYNHVSEWKQ